MSESDLREVFEELGARQDPPAHELRAALERLLDALEAGSVRAAEPSEEGWRINAWVKRGILLAFRGGLRTWDAPPLAFRDKETLPPVAPWSGGANVRIVPGGSSVRRGAHLGEGVVVMPPAFVNVGAFVGPSSMIDSHVLVGSCAQIGARVHLSAAVQVGGVLEPVGARPVIVEDDAFVGGGAGLYEGTRVSRRAVIAPGVVLTRSVPLYDLVRGERYGPDGSGGLVVPEGAVVVPGSRPAPGAFGRSSGLALYAPVIVKYRDAGSDAATALEEALR
ncbi:MAG TPA: 2,3,4,5-tetrahydropyridine-2,6-dicarboxylate N-succinyltransferase [Candidatus Binatia bacterium]|nr:2,3,4,5-tetrahydropyridine-2,6-dicarboxylate N-succinyltransferase [Candidatus Binatia bacterium]